MEMSASVMANEFMSHGKKEKSKTPTLQEREGRPPGRAKDPENAKSITSWRTYRSSTIKLLKNIK
jgi:hypothetical protein